MAVHIFAMNVLAPVLAAVVAGRLGHRDMRARWLWIAALGQAAALWAAHVPAVQSAAMARPLFQAAMQLLLAAIAVAFWLAVPAASATRPWHAVAALALSAKLFCLLAVLLVFAPRTLHGHHATALDDQQLAGLLDDRRMSFELPGCGAPAHDPVDRIGLPGCGRCAARDSGC